MTLNIQQHFIVRTVLLILGLSFTFPGLAQEVVSRQGLFWGFGLGGAYLERTFMSTNTNDEADGRLYMELFGGLALNPHVAIGLEIGGWTIEPDSDTYIWNPYWPPDNERSEEPEGEGLMQILAFTRIYPAEDRGLFLKLGAGYLEHWLKTDYQTLRKHGWTAVAGLGWDFPVGENWSLTPTLSYSYGTAGIQTHQAFTLSFGAMWHQWEVKNRIDFSTAQATRTPPFILNPGGAL